MGEDWRSSQVQSSSVFWISLLQDTPIYSLFLKFRYFMSSHINEVDPLISAACFVWDAKICFPANSSWDEINTNTNRAPSTGFIIMAFVGFVLF